MVLGGSQQLRAARRLRWPARRNAWSPPRKGGCGSYSRSALWRRLGWAASCQIRCLSTALPPFAGVAPGSFSLCGRAGC